MTEVNTAIKGEEIKTATFLWLQGESDAMAKKGDIYAASLKRVISQLRTDMGRKDINFVIGRISDRCAKLPGWIGVRRAQVEVAESDPRGAWIDTDDLNNIINKRGKKKTPSTIRLRVARSLASVLPRKPLN